MQWEEYMATDSCLSGGGGWCGDEFIAFQYPEELLDPDINHLEMLMILIGLRAWAEKFQNARLHLWCDNEVCVHVLSSDASRDKKLQEFLREISLVCARNNIDIKPNCIAYSRYHLGEPFQSLVDPRKSLGLKEVKVKPEWYYMSHEW